MTALDGLVDRARTISVRGRRRARIEAASLVEAANLAIARVNAEAPTDRQHRRPLDPALEAERLERAFGAGD
jgi:hypothetical protein